MALPRSGIFDELAKRPQATGKQFAGPGAAETSGVDKARALLERPVSEVAKEVAPLIAAAIPEDVGKKKVRDMVNDPKWGGTIRSQFGSYAQKLGFTQKDLDAAMQPAAAPEPSAKPAQQLQPPPGPVQAPAAAAAQASPAAAPAAPPAAASGRTVISPQLMRAIRQIESGGNPNARTGSYKGLYQLSDSEFSRLGGKGDIFNPQENERIAMLKLQREADQVAKQLGRPLTPGEIYLVHQQGVGGAPAHIQNPNQKAWQSMLSTGEGQQKGEKWAKLAIWGNIPDKDKARFGSVDNVTSADFAKLWYNQINRRGGGEGGEMKEAPLAAPEKPTSYSSPESAAAAENDAMLSKHVDPTPGVGSGQKDYDDAAAKEAAKGMVDPTPNVGSGASDYAPSTDIPVASVGGKDWAAGIGDILGGMGQAMGGGGGKALPSTPATIAMPHPTPQGAVPIVDPKVIEAQRQMLAQAMQRLNSGKLV